MNKIDIDKAHFIYNYVHQLKIRKKNTKTKFKWEVKAICTKNKIKNKYFYWQNN